MNDAPPQSPFARLDTDLMRSTKSVSDSPTDLTQKSQPQPTPQKSPSERANARTMHHPNGRRIITRNSFEIYEDQMDALRKLAARDLETTGKVGSMSAMVREAIDTFIQTKSSKK